MSDNTEEQLLAQQMDGLDPEAVLTNMMGLYSVKFEQAIKAINDAKDVRRLLMDFVTRPTGGTPIDMTPEVTEAFKLAELAKQEKEGAIQKFEDAIRQLSTGELKRLANALIMYPLSHKNFIENGSQNLGNVFAVGQKLLEAKMLYFQMSLMQYEQDRLQQEQQSQTAAVAVEQTAADNGETNG